MSEASMVFPVLPGKREVLNAFVKALTSEWRAQYDRAKHTVRSESWFFQSTAQGDFVIMHLSAIDPDAVFAGLATSQEPFETWFREQVKDITGVDLCVPPPSLPNRIFHWERMRSLAER